MADVIDYKVYGDDMQMVEVELDPGEGVRAEVGAMMFMEDGIERSIFKPCPSHAWQTGSLPPQDSITRMKTKG